MSLKNDIYSIFTQVREDLLGTNYDEGLSLSVNFSNLTDGIIYDAINDGTILDTLAYPTQTDPTEAEKTFNEYANALSSIKSTIETYFADTSNNNGNLTVLGDGTGADGDLGKPIGRAGYYYRYAIAHIRKLGLYRFKEIKTYDNLGNDDTEELIPDDWYNINDYPNLKDLYINTVYTSLFNNSGQDIWDSCGYWKYTVGFTPPEGEGNPLWDETSFNSTLLDTIESEFSYTNESSVLSEFVIDKESEIFPNNDSNVNRALSLMGIAKLVDTKSIVYRTIDDSYTNFIEFYEDKGINYLIDSFSIDTITPDKIRTT